MDVITCLVWLKFCVSQRRYILYWIESIDLSTQHVVKLVQMTYFKFIPSFNQLNSNAPHCQPSLIHLCLGLEQHFWKSRRIRVPNVHSVLDGDICMCSVCLNRIVIFTLLVTLLSHSDVLLHGMYHALFFLVCWSGINSDMCLSPFFRRENKIIESIRLFEGCYHLYYEPFTCKFRY